jgi:exonuclease SbcC
MRPVLLELNGFASFREPTRIDFGDAEYFALVGPTGAGKSTVIDALTFALYGSVARWDREGLVSPALAPTVNRGTVRLLFDVAGVRYSVVRELRRGGGKNPTVTVRSVRLERLLDPASLGAAEDETEVVAADSAVTPEVERLLGLSFKHFCTCVALPQGAFAEFLHATAGERQKILMKLLGLEVYERIQRRANDLAKQQGERASVLAEQLAGFADATPADLARLGARVEALGELAARVDAAVPGLVAVSGALERARVEVGAVTEERGLVSAVAMPAGIEELARSGRVAAEAVERAAAGVVGAEEVDKDARAALRNGPDRVVLERVLADWQVLAEVTEALPGLELAAKQARNAQDVADGVESDATGAADAARAAHETESRVERDVRVEVERARRERELVAGVRVPAGVAGVAEEMTRAEAELAAAVARAVAAERADQAARERLTGLPDAAGLSAAAGQARELAVFCAEQAAGLPERAARQERLVEARGEVSAAEAAVAGAQEALAAADRADRASVLRAHLHAGEACPVCAQEVSVVPAVEATEGLVGAQRAVEVAQRRLRAAMSGLQEAEKAQAHASATLVAAFGRAEQYRAGLPEGGSLPGLSVDSSAEELAAVRVAAEAAEARLTARLAERAGAVEAAGAAERELGAARGARERAQRAVDAVADAVTRARAGLRAARDPLVALGAPAVDELDVGAGWGALSGWAAQALVVRDAELAKLEEGARAQAERVAQAAEALRAAEEAATRARAASRRAALGEQEARSRFVDASRQRDAVSERLAGAPKADAARERLRQVAVLQRAADEADAALSTARDAAARARQRAEQVEREVGAARVELGRARDPLVRFGAPAIDDTDLAAGWAGLVGWARGQAGELARRLEVARAEEERLAAELRAAEQAVIDDLAGAEIEVGAPVRDRAPVAVATAITAARARRDELARRLAGAEKLTGDIAAAQEQARVAKQLADLMRSNQFPRWLVASALDTLVEEASRSLLELSGGQFELTHENGDFLVIDHNEADIPRPVKTLSGGETFQASLALALALSSQLGALAAAGATRLESIFLDEGFGTLDEATLDTVASTLENLASSGSRMVGVITHVAALAERVPVRFAVTRDANGSHIEREGLE